MRADQRENERYSQEDFCPVHLEEQIMFELFNESLKEWNKKPSEISVLDLGCGSGNISEKLLQRGCTVVGIDFSEVALEKARKKGITAKQANVDEGLPEPDNTYDVVWAGDIIEHVFDPMGLIKEVRRVLRPGGVFLLTIPNDVGLISRIMILCGISHQEQMYRASGFYKHHTFFTPRLIRFMLSHARLNTKDFKKILILGSKRYKIAGLPSAFFNEMIIKAVKK